VLLLFAFAFHAYTVVWNIKSQEKRLVELVPNDDWGGAGLLGVTIRIDNYGGADERLIRVLDVEQDSPASVAGLVPMKDYLLGTTVTGFGSAQVLASVLEQHIDHVVEMYVYNSDSDVVRVVPLMPTFNWGVGRGLLGAEVGTGYLHRLPNSCRSTIGHSVERKVRWMNKVKDASNSTDATATTGEDPKPTDQSLLEMEPHLEMEVEKDENNQHLNPEDVTKQPHQLGKAVMSPPRNGTQQQTQTAAPTAEQPASQASASETTAESQPQQQRASAAPAAETTSEVQQAPILVAPPILSSATSAEAVADLFSKPPPNSSQPPAVSNVPNVPFIPPPPKMQY
jgi:hypothetical protein